MTGIRGRYSPGAITNLQIVLNAKKNSVLRSSHTEKKIPESNVSNLKKYFDHRRHLKSDYPPFPTRVTVHTTLFSFVLGVRYHVLRLQVTHPSKLAGPSQRHLPSTTMNTNAKGLFILKTDLKSNLLQTQHPNNGKFSRLGRRQNVQAFS